MAGWDERMNIARLKRWLNRLGCTMLALRPGGSAGLLRVVSILSTYTLGMLFIGYHGPDIFSSILFGSPCEACGRYLPPLEGLVLAKATFWGLVILAGVIVVACLLVAVTVLVEELDKRTPRVFECDRPEGPRRTGDGNEGAPIPQVPAQDAHEQD